MSLTLRLLGYYGSVPTQQTLDGGEVYKVNGTLEGVLMVFEAMGFTMLGAGLGKKFLGEPDILFACPLLYLENFAKFDF